MSMTEEQIKEFLENRKKKTYTRVRTANASQSIDGMNYTLYIVEAIYSLHEPVDSDVWKVIHITADSKEASDVELLVKSCFVEGINEFLQSKPTLFGL